MCTRASIPRSIVIVNDSNNLHGLDWCAGLANVNSLCRCPFREHLNLEGGAIFLPLPLIDLLYQMLDS